MKTLKLKWYDQNGKTNNKINEQEFFDFHFKTFAEKLGYQSNDFKDPLNVSKNHKTLRIDFM